MNRKILGNSFFMGLHLTGISRLRRAPGRRSHRQRIAQSHTEPRLRAWARFVPANGSTHTHKIQVCSHFVSSLCNTSSPHPAEQVSAPHALCQHRLTPAGSRAPGRRAGQPARTASAEPLCPAERAERAELLTHQKPRLQSCLLPARGEEKTQRLTCF